MKKKHRTWKKGFLQLNWDQNDTAGQEFYLTEVFKMLQTKYDMKIILLFIYLLNKKLQ